AAREGAAPAPVLDSARVPAFVSQTVASLRLAQRLDPVLTGRDASCLVVDDSAGSELYSRRPGVPLIPASNLKLLTAAAALRKLGAGERLHTEVRALRPAVNGVVTGDVWLVGGGDPLLATADYAAQAGYQHQPRGRTALEDLAAKMAAAGVRQVTGRVLGDESRYDTRRGVPSWSPAYAATFEIGPLSAMTVNDNFAQWTPRIVPAPLPPANSAAVLSSLLQARGVQVGGAGDGRAPAGAAVVASIDSPPVADVIAEMLTQSENLAAELLTKELGRRAAGSGTTDTGVKAILAALGEQHQPLDGVTLTDGSGLDRGNRVTCQALLGVLGSDGPGGVVARGLPVAGRTGTLWRRYNGTPLEGRLRAKTGTLSGVASFSGWMAAGQNKQVDFSFIVNGIGSEAEGHSLEDRVANALVAYPEAPPPSALTGDVP
ncbi:MAG: D-alanyl-D-alanine carboxypeptidase/D-alanyl-D-alanine-endopeptidase, partial [Acidimicrobiales bacterium]|nr:D-alanyl-D-alanine carboxypeptidase/D-alanyl-D-alanine-endopeptidase [Acidimicrobiales bacterium]